MSHEEIFDEFEQYKIEIAHEITSCKTTRLMAETTDCLAGTYKKLSTD